MSWDGKMYDKYRIAHMDGTPLKGKKYFVLRLDSDDPVEAARVAAAMRAYKGEPRNCDVGTARGRRLPPLRRTPTRRTSGVQHGFWPRGRPYRPRRKKGKGTARGKCAALER